MKRYKVRQVLKLLKDDGWEIVRTKGDHRQLKNSNEMPGTVTISGKLNQTISQELLNSIWKQAGWR
ncbi:MAG: type II toxin-antitoxin system HicA family toxin [Bacteroidales bacterium]|nr:type II toxin-antitoxin system HicA family toxin [Bacteroidales bacterium]